MTIYDSAIQKTSIPSTQFGTPRSENDGKTRHRTLPHIRKEVTTWARACIQCQKAKITKHNATPMGKFMSPIRRFEHIHTDLVGPLSISNGYKYCLTIMNRFMRWPKAIPDITAETIAQKIFEEWITRYGTPARIINQGRQFESDLFRQLTQLTGSTHLKTTAYHPASNRMVEKLHRHIKATISVLYLSVQ